MGYSDIDAARGFPYGSLHTTNYRSTPTDFDGERNDDGRTSMAGPTFAQLPWVMKTMTYWSLFAIAGFIKTLSALGAAGRPGKKPAQCVVFIS